MIPARKILAFSLIVFSTGLYAKDKHQKADQPQDEIQVVAHLPVTGEPIVHFLSTQHYRRNYLYAEHQSGKTVTLIDITNLNQPSVLAEMNYPAGPSDGLVAVAGNAALVTTTGSQTEAAQPAQTFRILSFADPLHPAVKQEFNGVTATMRDEKRGLIFLANADGVWILQQRLAMDPQAEKEWEHMMLDAR